MPPVDILALLRAAVPLLEEGVVRSWFHRRRRLAVAASIRSVLSPSAEFAAPAELVDETRRRWAGDARVRIEQPSLMTFDQDGIWLRALLLAGDIAPIDRGDLAIALAQLPLMPREVYSLSRRDGLTFGQIGERLGISSDEVGRQLAAALIELDRLVPGN